MLNLRARFVSACTVLCMLSKMLSAAPALTTIQDTLYKADGSRFNGILQITWTSFQSADTSNIATHSVTAQVANGYLRVLLVPTTNATVPGMYTVVYNSDGRVQFTEAWVVPPSTAPLRVADVRSMRAPAGAAALTQMQVADIAGLRTELNIRPTIGAGFAASRAAVIDASGGVTSAAGNLTDCVHVDGSSGPCGSSGGGPGGPGPAFTDAEAPAGLVDGVNTAFQLAKAPSPGSSVTLYRNGLALQNGIDFTVNGATITFAAGGVPQPGDVLQAFYRTASGILGGAAGNATQIQGRNVAATAPSNGQVLGWVNANSNWEPVNAGTLPTLKADGVTAGSEPVINLASGNGIRQTCVDSAGVQVTCTSSLDTAVALTNAAAQANRPWFCKSTNGTSAYTCSLPAAPLTTYTAGMCLDLLADTTNTGAATLNVDGAGLRSIKQANGASDPAAGMITSGTQIRTCYDGSVWRLPPANAPTQSGMVAWNGTYLNRSIVGSGGVRCTNGDGVGGNPTCSADTSVMQAQNYAPDAGVADAYAVVLPVAPAALSDGLLVTFKAAHANSTAAPTMAVNGLAAKAIKKYTGMLLDAGDIAANGVYELRYESSCDCFQMQSLPAKTPAAGLTVQDNAGSVVGTRPILQILNGTYLTCTLADAGSKLTQQCEANTTRLVDRTQANSWTAGATQIFQSSSTTEGLNLAPGVLPTAPSSGALAVSNSDNSLNVFDGAVWNKVVTATASLTSGAPLLGLGGNRVGPATTTGTGNIVFSSSPVLALPVIGNFSNANHDHTNVANGGTVPASAIMAAFTGTCDSSHALFGDGSCKAVGMPVRQYGGLLIPSTSPTAYVVAPQACTINSFNIMVDTGTATVKFWKAPTGTALPTASNSINTSGVSISAGTVLHGTALTDFTTTSVAAHDIIAATITASSGASWVYATVECQ